ncbi:poly-beta-1,6 N-acetyl-D-glucosamine export porin PgaA, partial [Escherichia coli]|nr:poly-beta-1,6 N-acetyl-D-glucosamine export porin PgaA [Klebsiella pneumoniae]MXD72860.1 poly-beta-1,6 N-acetyl-D-glucosamine export porin PgaA [Escherichia coli]
TSPPFLRLMGTPTSIPNDTWLQGHSFLSTVAKYSNDLPQAEMTARELAYNAPGNQGLRIDYASVLQARGWPRAAENELKKAEVI